VIIASATTSETTRKRTRVGRSLEDVDVEAGEAGAGWEWDTAEDVWGWGGADFRFGIFDFRLESRVERDEGGQSGGGGSSGVCGLRGEDRENGGEAGRGIKSLRPFG
jgi:hypothetical protein